MGALFNGERTQGRREFPQTGKPDGALPPPRDAFSEQRSPILLRRHAGCQIVVRRAKHSTEYAAANQSLCTSHA